jgi:hypothetical protein
MPGGEAWDLLAPFAESRAAAWSRGRLFDTGDGYPAARFALGPAEPIGQVHGLRIRLRNPAVAFAALDDFEGPGYRRVIVTTDRGPADAYEWLGAWHSLRELTQGHWPS